MAENMLDVFKGTGYDLVSLTDKIEKLPHKPMRISDMGLFEEEGIDTLVVNIEERSGTLELVPAKPRGAPGTPVSDPKRVLRNLSLIHLPQSGAVMADEVQGIRAFGGISERDQIDAKVTRELQIMKDKLDVTIEWMKIGALKGLILQIDSAGSISTLYNLFTELGVSQQTHDMNLDVDATDVITECRRIIRKIESALGVFGYQGIHGFAGPDFMDALLAHDSVRQFVLNWQDARFFREDDLRYGAVRIGNIVWEEYRGTVNGTKYIEDDEAFVFPIGVPNMFKCHFGPANYAETVNTIGRPYYSKQKMMDFDKGVEFESQSNPLALNKRPNAVIKVGQNSAS
jgi:hypothetical protein